MNMRGIGDLGAEAGAEAEAEAETEEGG